MKSAVMFLFASIMVCLIVGCSTEQPNPVLSIDTPSPAKLDGVSTDTEISWNGSLITNSCTNEDILCTGSLVIQYQLTPATSGGWHITCHMKSESLEGTSQSTGIRYKITESSMFSAEVRPPYPIVSTQTIKVTMKGSDGSRFRLHLHLHITLDSAGALKITGNDAVGVCS